MPAAPPTSPSSSHSSHSSSSSHSSTSSARVLGEQVANDGTDPALAATGGVPIRLLLLALGLLAAGAGVTFAATDRGARHR